jgi:hypothetical protein
MRARLVEHLEGLVARLSGEISKAVPKILVDEDEFVGRNIHDVDPEGDHVEMGLEQAAFIHFFAVGVLR